MLWTLSLVTTSPTRVYNYSLIVSAAQRYDDAACPHRRVALLVNDSISIILALNLRFRTKPRYTTIEYISTNGSL